MKHSRTQGRNHRVTAENIAFLEEEFRSRALQYPHSKIFLLPALAAREFLLRCRDFDLVLLGLDGFIVHDGPQLQPTLEFSSDYSSPDMKSLPMDAKYKMALELVDRPAASHLYFEIYIDDQN